MPPRRSTAINARSISEDAIGWGHSAEPCHGTLLMQDYSLAKYTEDL